MLSTGTHRKVEAVFQPEFSRIFSEDFRPFPTEKHRELARIHWEKVGKTSGRNTAFIFGAFPQDTVTFSHLFWKIRRDPVVGIFVLGSFLEALDIAKQSMDDFIVSFPFAFNDRTKEMIRSRLEKFSQYDRARFNDLLTYWGIKRD
jgi:hypothetical protein